MKIKQGRFTLMDLMIQRSRTFASEQHPAYNFRSHKEKESSNLTRGLMTIRVGGQGAGCGLIFGPFCFHG